MKRIAIDIDDVIAKTLTRRDLAEKKLWDAIGKEHFPTLKEVTSFASKFARLELYRGLWRLWAQASANSSRSNFRTMRRA